MLELVKVRDARSEGIDSRRRSTLLHLRLDLQKLMTRQHTARLQVLYYERLQGGTNLHLLAFGLLLNFLDVSFHPLAAMMESVMGGGVHISRILHFLINVLQSAVHGTLGFGRILLQKHRTDQLVNCGIIFEILEFLIFDQKW